MLGDSFTIEQGDYLPPGMLNLILKWEGKGQPTPVDGVVWASADPFGDWVLVGTSIMEIEDFSSRGESTLICITGLLKGSSQCGGRYSLLTKLGT